MPEQPLPQDHAEPIAARVFRLTDFDQLTRMFPNWSGRFEQLSTGRFEGRLHVVRGSVVRVVEVEANQRVLIRGHDQSRLVSIYLVTPGSVGGMWQGRTLDVGQLVVHGPEHEADHRSARRPENLSFSLSVEDFEMASESLLNGASFTIPRSRTILTPRLEFYARLQGCLSLLLNKGLLPGFLGTPEAYQLEQECVRALVSLMSSAHVDHGSPPLPGRVLLLRRAEEYMRSRLSSPVGAINICRELGVSDRSLRLAFRERYNLGPMTYYKYLRLNAVRSRLKADQHLSITDVAREFGFYHLGNFAADYRRLFGEGPSKTPRLLCQAKTNPVDDCLPSLTPIPSQLSESYYG